MEMEFAPFAGVACAEGKGTLAAVNNALAVGSVFVLFKFPYKINTVIGDKVAAAFIIRHH